MKFVVYQDKAEEWRWRLRAANGNIVADSGEGYSTESNCRRAIRRLKVEVYRAGVIVW